MSTRAEFDIAFQVITEGAQARISDELKRRLFGQQWARVMQGIQSKADKWINTREVQGLAVGTRTRAGTRTDELAIVVYVDRKRPTDQVRKPVPDEIRIDGLGTFATDVVAVGQVRPLQYADYVRPAMPGCSIGHYNMQTYGTFGLLVKKRPGEGAGVFILSNSHILALDGLAAAGDDIVQPGPGDNVGSSGTIARLDDWVKFKFTTSGWPNLVDAAIARVVNPKSNVTNCIREIEVIPVATSSQVTVGMTVKKVGRTSDCVSSTVKETSANVKYKHMKTKTTADWVRYSDQVRCGRIAGPGDSGSIVLNAQNEVVGLLSAGTDSDCWFNKIDNVFSALKIEIA
jgi:S1-C subfamily serine protease